MKEKSKLGFSLIELSIVILIIGILVLGITKGSRIINEARIKSANSLTNNSPVASTSHLLLWLETTSNKSFDTGIANDNVITNWYDLNPQNTEKNNATQSILADQPIYNTNAINGLPAITFDGVSDNMSFNGLALNGSNYTMFFVEKRNSGKNDNTLLGDSSSSGGIILRYTSSTTLRCSQGGGMNNSNTSAYSGSAFARILSFTYNGSTATTYLNGTALSSTALPSASGFSNAVFGMYFGAGHFYQGAIGEIIIFNRFLNTRERQSIESYLSQKWGTKLS